MLAKTPGENTGSGTWRSHDKNRLVDLILHIGAIVARRLLRLHWFSRSTRFILRGPPSILQPTGGIGCADGWKRRMEQFSFLEFRKSLVGKITRVLPNRTRCSACCLNLALTVSGRGRRGLTRLLRLAAPHKIWGLD